MNSMPTQRIGAAIIKGSLSRKTASRASARKPGHQSEKMSAIASQANQAVGSVSRTHCTLSTQKTRPPAHAPR